MSNQRKLEKADYSRKIYESSALNEFLRDPLPKVITKALFWQMSQNHKFLSRYLLFVTKSFWAATKRYHQKRCSIKICYP